MIIDGVIAYVVVIVCVIWGFTSGLLESSMGEYINLEEDLPYGLFGAVVGLLLGVFITVFWFILIPMEFIILLCNISIYFKKKK